MTGGGVLPPPVERLLAALPGLRAEEVFGAPVLARALRRAGPPRPAAVLVLLSPGTGGGVAGVSGGSGGSGVDVVLVERAAGPGAHAGQVALPGGGVDATDASAAAAALREADEETGLDDGAVVVLGELPELAVPVSGYLVVPVLAWQPVPTPLAPGDPREIAAVHRVPLVVLADPEHRVRVGAPLTSGAPSRAPAAPRWTGPGFVVGDLLVWGFTALVLDAVLRLAGMERPWQRDRVVDLPRRFAGASGPG